MKLEDDWPDLGRPTRKSDWFLKLAVVIELAIVAVVALGVWFLVRA